MWQAALLTSAPVDAGPAPRRTGVLASCKEIVYKVALKRAVPEGVSMSVVPIRPVM